MNALLKQYFWVLNLLVIGLCAGFAGRAASHAIEGAYLTSEGGRPNERRATTASMVPKVHSKEIDAIVHRNIFCSGCAPVTPTVKESGVDANVAQKSSLQLELISTMLCPSDDAWSMAVLHDLSSKEKDSAMFAKGRSIFATGAVVTRVMPGRVEFRNNGQLEFLELESGAPPATAVATPPPATLGLDPSLGDIDSGVTCNGNNCTIDRAVLDKLLMNTAALSSAVRVVPSMTNGKPNGFKLFAIRPNSIFGRIGLQNGDTLRAINGNEMSTPDKALELYTKLRTASHLTVQVERRGQTTTMDYTIR